MSREPTLHLDVDEKLPATDAFRYLIATLDANKVGNIVTDRFCRRLINELGGVKSTG
jgi:hypothetical protein